MKPFALIVTDCNMPVMDGLEMGFEIKKYYDEFIKSFVKIKNSQILGVHK
jgi:CheY-like chemotaxis protein